MPNGREIRTVTQAMAAAAGERVVRSARTADAVEAIVRRLWIEFLRSVSANASPASIKAALTRVFARLDREVTQAVGERLAKDIDAGRADSAAAVQAVPVEITASALAVKAGVPVLQEQQQRGGVAADLEIRPGMTKEEVDAILIPPLDADKTREILERPVNGESWQDRLSGLSKRIVDRDALVDSMARGLADGKTPRELVDDVLPHVAGYGAAARRIARTESLRVQHEANQDVLDELGDEIVGYTREVTLDDVTGDDHRPLAGKFYPKGTEPRLPDRPNCRCWLAPVFADEPLVRVIDPATGLPGVGVKQLDLADTDSTYNAGTYDQWFDRQPAEVQREIVGKTRWSAVAPATAGTRAPKWSDFVKPDGSLEAASKLKGSTPQSLADRAERRRIAQRNETAATLQAARAQGTQVAVRTGPLAGNVQATSRPFAGGDVPPDATPPTATVSAPSGPQPKPYVPPPLPPPVPDRKALAAVLASDPDLDKLAKRLGKATQSARSSTAATARTRRDIKAGYDAAQKLLDEYRKTPTPELQAKLLDAARRDRELRDELAAKADPIEAENMRTLAAVLAVPAKERYDRQGFGGKPRTDLPVEPKMGKAAANPDRKTEQKHRQAMDLLRSLLRRGGAESKVRADLVQLEGRAYHDPRDGAVRMDSRSPLAVHVHELAHSIETDVPGVQKACREFLEHRRNGQPLRKLSDAIPGHTDPNLAFDDDFGRAFTPEEAWYVGKQYDFGATEVLSMGLQRLVEDPAGFIKKDPEYAKFVLGLLTGKTRM